jgi:hypothetical protein
MQPLSRVSNQQALALGIALMAAVGACLAAVSIVTQNYRDLTLTLVIGAGVFCAVFIVRDWRLGVGLFFFWVVIEDLVRKYLGNAMIIYATKDLLIAFTYASYWLAAVRQEKRGDAWRNPIRVPLLLWFAWALIGALNPGIDNYLVPLLGLRMSFLYVPMIYLGYAFFRSERHFRTFTLSVLTVAAILGVLGMVQVQYGLELLNPEAGPYLVQYLVRYVPGTELTVPRPTATFVNAGRYAQYLFVMMYMGFGMLLYLHLSRQKLAPRARRWALVCWVSVLMGLFVSGQRAAILWLLLSAIPLALAQFYLMAKTRGLGRSLPMTRIVLGGVLAFVLLGVLLPERFEAAFSFYWTTIDPRSSFTEAESRPRSIWKDIAYAFSASGPMGHGTGTASLGLQYVMQASPQYAGNLYHIEGGYAAVLWEWGVVGLVLWVWWSGLLMLHLLRKITSLVATQYYWFSVVTAVCLFIIIFPWFSMGMQIYQNYLTQAFFWFLVGVLFRLPDLPAAEPLPASRRASRPLALAETR